MTDAETKPTFAPGSEEEWQYYMDATQTVIQLKPGPLTQAEVWEIQFVDDYHRRDGDNVVDAHHEGYQQGLIAAGRAGVPELLNKIDELHSELATANALRKFSENRSDRAEATLARWKAILTPAVEAVKGAGTTRLQADYCPGDPKEGVNEGWRIHDFPAEPNPQGVWYANMICDGMEEGEAKAFIAAVNAVRDLAGVIGEVKP